MPLPGIEAETMRRKLRWILLGLAALLLAAAAAIYLVPLPARLKSPGSRMVLFADRTPAYVFLSADDKWRIPVRLREVDPLLLRALIAWEDRRFYYHPGVDPLAVVRALGQNLAAGEIVSGASTLTMQLVRILEPRPRTFASKAIEAARALQLEARLNKAAILEAFLQFAPYGRNIEGLEAASFAYFGHSAASLDPFEIAYLVSVPQDPTHRYPAPANLARMRRGTQRAAFRLKAEGIFNARQLEQAVKGNYPRQLQPFPRSAPHAAVWLQSRAVAGDRIYSTLERPAQTLAENTLQSYRASLANLGISNGAAVVIERRTGRVAALVGNFDFWDEAHQGQVVGFDAPRSPGSALKPFLYALAIDRALALPTYLVPDLPVRFREYEPRNYDDQFHGLVRLQDALSQSLNVPFVNLLAQIGVDPFLSFLGEAGITTLSREQGHYGLSLAIGGVDVTLLELTNLYAALARQGRYQDYRLFLDDSPRPAPRQILSPAAAYLTAQALSIRDRPDFPERRQAVALPPNIHWKTGTSYGHRDAWVVGSNPEYTVGVWLGNFDSTPSSALVGAEAAGPILFDLLEGLSNRTLAGRLPEPPPLDLTEVEVCAYSGRLPNPFCPRRERTLAPRTNLPVEPCPYHLRFQIDDATGHALCPLCRAGRSYHEEVFTLLPATVRRWISDQRLLLPGPPSHLPACPHAAAAAASAPPRIVSPQPNAIYFLIPGLDPHKQEIPLEAEAAAAESELQWFIDGRFLQKTAPAERVWLTPVPGEHEIRVIDSAGRLAQVRIRIINAG